MHIVRRKTAPVVVPPGPAPAVAKRVCSLKSVIMHHSITAKGSAAEATVVVPEILKRSKSVIGGLLGTPHVLLRSIPETTHLLRSIQTTIHAAVHTAIHAARSLPAVANGLYLNGRKNCF